MVWRQNASVHGAALPLPSAAAPQMHADCQTHPDSQLQPSSEFGKAESNARGERQNAVNAHGGGRADTKALEQ